VLGDWHVIALVAITARYATSTGETPASGVDFRLRRSVAYTDSGKSETA
jgi:hypothetical protein